MEFDHAMAHRKPTSRSVDRKHAKQTKPRADLPTYPRPDLSPPELVISSLAESGQVILAFNERNHELNDEDREAVERAVGQLNELELYDLIGQIPSEPTVIDPQLADELAKLKRRLVEWIGTIAGAAYLIGAHGAMTDTSRVFFVQSHAMQMRQQRATSHKEQRLRDAIEAEMKAAGRTIPSERPYKDAGSILADVNKRLTEQGQQPVSVYAINRRLRQRSSRTQKKKRCAL
jgi:hypothetical protein